MIEQPGKKKMLLFSGSSNEELASKVASNLGTEVSTVESKEFASGEIYIRLNESVRGADCFVLQSHSGDINKTIMEQLVLVDALKRASAKRITAVLPFYPYSRQDKKALPREPITARLVATLDASSSFEEPENRSIFFFPGCSIIFSFSYRHILRHFFDYFSQFLMLLMEHL